MAEIRYNKAIVKNINESLIRKALHGEGPFTKTMIARMTELSFPTVSRIVDEMVRSGEILLCGMDASTGGRHAQSFVINPNFAYCLCMYMPSYAMIRVFLIDSLGKIVTSEEMDLPEWTLGLVEIMDGLVENYMNLYPIRALSIGLPFGISAKGTILFGSESSGLKDFPIQQHMEAKFKIRTRVENDMNTMVTGCYKRMFKEDGRSLALVNFGESGCGCGLYLRGHLVRGHRGFAGELRYLPADADNNMERCYSNGMLERPELIAQMLSSICCIVDPHTIVLYKNADTEKILPQVEELCKKYIPEDVIPKIVVTDKKREDFENGLISFGLDLLMVGYEIVNR